MNLGQTVDHQLEVKPSATPAMRRWSMSIVAGLTLAALLIMALAQVRDQSASLPAMPDDVCIVALPQSYDPSSGLALLSPRAVPLDARCPVCGMYPARSRDWAAQLIFTNGDTHFFDSPLSLHLYRQAIERYSPGRHAADVAATYVTDAATGVWTPADQAHYVHGSTALGPMRNGNLPAFASQVAAQQFAQRRGGQVLRAEQISPGLLAALNTRRAHSHVLPPS